jgi:hypothetical protein
MIIKLDHISYACINFDDEVKSWLSRGYKAKFVEKRVKNPGIKRGLMSRFSSRHDLAFLEGKHFNVELIDHGHVISGEQFLQPLSQMRTAMPIFNMQARNIAKSVFFWQSFGFRLNKITGSLSLADPVSQKKTIINLVKASGKQDFFLDGAGANCLSFVSSSVENERNFLKSRGFKVTVVEKLKLNKKNLNIFFVRGPSGELAEVFSIGK